MVMAADSGDSWPETHRQRLAIVVVDVVESVRLMQQHEADFIDRWLRFVKQVRTQVLAQWDGRLVKSLGDGMLLEFRATPQAIGAAFQLQALAAQHARERAADGAVALRIGIHVDDVVVDELDVYGKGVNLAARLATLAAPGQCVVSSDVRDEVVDGLDANVEDLGLCYLKNLSEPVRAFLVRNEFAPPREPRSRPADLRPVIAVLAPVLQGGGDDHGVYGEVLADELTVSLSRCAELQVISRLSTAALGRRVVPPPGLDAGLEAHFVLSGSYSVAGSRLRLRVVLHESGRGAALWADAVDADGQALLLGREPAVDRLLQGVGAAITARELTLASTKPLPNVQSHALMSAAITLMHRATRQDYERAHAMLSHLLERHRGSPQPHAWLAKWLVLGAVQGWSKDPLADGQRALDAGHRALHGDPDSSLALTMQGLVHAYLRHDFDQASQAYASALAIDPNESLALLLSGTMHAFLGEGEPAWRLTQGSLRLSPLDPLRYFYLSLSASAAISAGRYEDAIDLAGRSLKLNRMHTSTYRAMAIAQSLAGRRSEARATLDALLALEPGFTLETFRRRFPGRERAPDYTRFLVDALEQAGLPP